MASKYFVCNKKLDFDRGAGENVQWTADGIAMQDSEKAAYFYSRVFDSREKQTIWHRIRLRAKSLGDASIRFTFYVSEVPYLLQDGQTRQIAEVLQDTHLSMTEKKQLFAPYAVKTAQNPTDALLHEAQGRYLWFLAELFGFGGQSPVLEHIRIDFPKETWLQYLPEIYQNPPESASFTERFLSIFQSLYDSIEAEMAQLPAKLDPTAAEGEFLHWLAGWLDLEDTYLWTEAQLRYLLQHAMEFYRKRGTRQGIAELIALYTGEMPYLIEHSALRAVSDDMRIRERMRRLYGDSDFLFTVVVREEVVPDAKTYQTLLKLIENAKPAHTEVNVVVLKPYLFLEKYTYLGMNSVLGQYRTAGLDGFAALPLTGLL